MQVFWAQHQEFEYKRLEEPAYNLAAAATIKARNGWGPWNPLPDPNGLLAQTVKGMLTGGSGATTTEPGVSLAADIQAAPQANAATLPPAPQPQPDLPPPYIPPEITIPQLNEAEDGADGFDNIVRYYKRDLPYLVAYDNALIREITQLTGG